MFMKDLAGFTDRWESPSTWRGSRNNATVHVQQQARHVASSRQIVVTGCYRVSICKACIFR